MRSHSLARFGGLAAAAALALAVLATAWYGSAGLAAAADGPEPLPGFGQLESAALPTETKPAVSVDNGLSQVTEGTDVTYRITVENQSATSDLATTVDATLPQGLRFDSADAGGVRKGGQVSWTVRTAPEARRVLTLKGHVGARPAGVDRLALVACAEGDEPVCATDMDGVALPGRVSWTTAVLGVSAALALLAGLAFLLLRRKKPATEVKVPAQAVAGAGQDAAGEKDWNEVCYAAVAEAPQVPGPAGSPEPSEPVK
ncbi:hypothetical protein ABT160_38005 [Streptomyces sp. NPDC001941]|uniref:hypothetical protein n=1 Tax=Streptomyces sp. NPDC001941 TaxID=3154659 RepID=UPI00332B1F51